MKKLENTPDWMKRQYAFTQVVMKGWTKSRFTKKEQKDKAILQGIKEGKKRRKK